MTKDLWTETFGAPPRTARRATAAWSRRWERPRVVLWTSWPRRTRAARLTVRLVAMRPRPRVPPADAPRASRAGLRRRRSRRSHAGPVAQPARGGCARLPPPRPEQLRPGLPRARGLLRHRRRPRLPPQPRELPRLARESSRARHRVPVREPRSRRRHAQARRRARRRRAAWDARRRLPRRPPRRRRPRRRRVQRAVPRLGPPRQHLPASPPRRRRRATRARAEAESSTGPLPVGVATRGGRFAHGHRLGDVRGDEDVARGRYWIPNRCLHAARGAGAARPACFDSSPRVTCVTRANTSSRRRRSTRYRPRRRRTSRGSWGTGTRGSRGAGGLRRSRTRGLAHGFEKRRILRVPADTDSLCHAQRDSRTRLRLPPIPPAEPLVVGSSFRSPARPSPPPRRDATSSG